jgi:hypothetical protein
MGMGWDGFMEGLLTNGVRMDGFWKEFSPDMITMVMASLLFFCFFSSISFLLFLFSPVWLFSMVHGLLTLHDTLQCENILLLITHHDFGYKVLLSFLLSVTCIQELLQSELYVSHL